VQVCDGTALRRRIGADRILARNESADGELVLAAVIVDPAIVLLAVCVPGKPYLSELQVSDAVQSAALRRAKRNILIVGSGDGSNVNAVADDRARPPCIGKVRTTRR